jgi:hypothetical protein
MVSVFGMVMTMFIVLFVGGGVAYLFWVKTRPKKETWMAKVYQLGEGIRHPDIDDNGRVVSDLKLQDLRPYAKDVIEKIEKDTGITIFKLVKLHKVVPAIESDVVDYWGNDHREVSVLLHKDGCTLLKKGYDKVSGEAIFRPLPHSRVNIIKGEMAIRKDRLKKEKDILEAISPWIIAGICVMGLVAIAYVLGSSYVQMSNNNADAAKAVAQANTALLELEKLRYTVTPTTNNNLGQQTPGAIIIPE